MRRRVLFLVAMMLLFGLSRPSYGAAAIGGRVPVVACPPIVSDVPGYPVPTQPQVPDTYLLPAGVSLPDGAAVYGAGDPGESDVLYAVGPSGYTCTTRGGGELPAFGLSLTPPGATRPALVFSTNAGGEGDVANVVCDFWPGKTDITGATCPQPSGSGATVVPVGGAGSEVPAELVLMPPGASFEGLSTSGVPGQKTIAYVDQNSKEAECTLPDTQIGVCGSALSLFVAQMETGTGRIDALAAISAHTMASGASPSQGTDEPLRCDAAVDVAAGLAIEKEEKPNIPIPESSVISLASRVQLSPEFTLGSVKVCDSGLGAVVGDPSAGIAVMLSADKKSGEHANWGPFEYSAFTSRWIEAPGAPSGQRLETDYKYLDAHIETGAHLTALLKANAKKPEYAISLVTIELQGLPRSFTLVADGESRLEATLGPTIALSVEIKLGDLEQEIGENEAEGESSAQAVDEVSEQVTTDAVIEADEESSAFFGVQLTPAQEDSVVIEESGLLDETLTADPALVEAFAADAIASEVGVGEAAEIDAAAGVDDLLIEVPEVIIAILRVIP